MPAHQLTANEHLLDAFIRHQIGIQRYGSRVRRKVSELLDATETDIRASISKMTRRGAGYGSPANVKKLNTLLADLAEIRAGAWTGASKLLTDEMTALALAEPMFVAGMMETVAPFHVEFATPSAARLRDIVKSRPFEGDVLSGWAKKTEAADVARIHQQIRIGSVRGETAPQMARRIVGTVSRRGANGVTQIARNQAESMVMTATNHTANEARQDFYAENATMIKGEQYVAVLDSRTTPVCSDNDGKRFKVGEGPVPPLHFRCRSTRVPYFDDDIASHRPARNFTEGQLMREYTAKNKLKQAKIVSRAKDGTKASKVIDRAPKKRSELLRGQKGAYDEFRRKRMRELTGTVPDKTTYRDFLQRQPAANQDDILGKAKGKLYRGGMDIGKFVDTAGNERSLADLARTEAHAFSAVGLDPAGYLK